MPKGMRNPAEEMRQGIDGGAGGVRGMLPALAPAAVAGGTAVTLKNAQIRDAQQRKAEDKAEREAEDELKRESRRASPGMKKGGVASASKRADGIAQRGKTRGKMV